MTYKKLQNNFERELLFQIITKIRRAQISSIRARKIAQAFLPALKSKDAETFIGILNKLCYGYPEMLEAYIKAVKEYEDEKVTEGLVKARTNIKRAIVNENMKGGEQHGI